LKSTSPCSSNFVYLWKKRFEKKFYESWDNACEQHDEYNNRFWYYFQICL